MIIELNDKNFKKEVLRSEKPVLVDFFAPWCGPCQMFAPIFKATANTYKDKVKFAKINVENAPLTSSQFGIQSVPSLLLFKDGKVAASHLGALDEATLKSWVDNKLK